MPTPKDFFNAGRVTDAIAALSAWLRDNPGDVPQRTFLFELLCFAGQYDRAEKQLAFFPRAIREPSRRDALLLRSPCRAQPQRVIPYRNLSQDRSLTRNLRNPQR